MRIYVVSSVGTGTTLLSAFDKALYNAGTHNYNLITLSSVIPPKTEIIKTKQYKAPVGEFGYRLYVVKAEVRSNDKGKVLAAGVGWYQLEDKRGFFVEHHLEGKNEKALRREMENQITNSLKDMLESRGIIFDPKKVNSSIALAEVKDKPTSALSIAVYRSEDWN